MAGRIGDGRSEIAARIGKLRDIPGLHRTGVSMLKERPRLGFGSSKFGKFYLRRVSQSIERKPRQWLLALFPFLNDFCCLGIPKLLALRFKAR